MIAVPIIVTILVVEGIAFGISALAVRDFMDGPRPGSARWWRAVGLCLRNFHLVILAIILAFALIVGLVFLWYWGTGNVDGFFGTA